MKRLIATTAVCVSLFGFTAVAGAAPGAPSPNPNGPTHTTAACTAVSTHNPVLQPSSPPNLGVAYLEGVGTVFCP